MKKVRIFARVIAKPGREKEVREILRGLLAPTRLEEGCLFYDLYESDAGGLFVFHELWQSKASLERHAASSHLRRAKERLGPGLLASEAEVIEVNEIDQPVSGKPAAV